MTHFLERRDPWGHGMGLWVLLGMLFITPLAFWSLRGLRLDNNVENWLPDDDPQARTLNWFREHFSLEDHILISWEGSSLKDPRLIPFVARLNGIRDDEGIRRQGLWAVERAIGPDELIERMVRHDVSREDAVRRLRGVLLGPGPLHVRLTEAGRGSAEAFVAEFLRRARSELGIPLEAAPAASGHAASLDHPGAGQDESFARDGEAWQPEDERAGELRFTWPGMHAAPEAAARIELLAFEIRGPPTALNPEGTPLAERVFFEPGAPAALSVVLSEAGSADLAGALEAIRAAAEEVGIEPGELRLGGSPVAASEINRFVLRAFWNTDAPLFQLHRRSPFLLTVLAGVVLALVLVGSLRLAVLVLITAEFAALVTVALVPLTHGSMNMVLIVMPTLLAVLTLSAAIHVANYWKHAARRDLRTAVIEAARMARQPCLLASVTTAIGLLSLAASPLAPVRGFGLYSAAGCLISVVVVLYGFPALLQFWPTAAPRGAEADHAAWKRLAGLVTGQWRSVSLACLAAFAVSAGGLAWFRTETKVIRYFPSDARIVEDYHYLEDHLAGIVPIEMVVRFDETVRRQLTFRERSELVRRIQDEMRARPGISGTLSLADFFEIPPPPPAQASFLQKARYNRTLHEMEQRITNGRQSEAASFLTLARHGDRLPLARSRTLTVNEGDELWRITAQVAVMSDGHYAALTGDWNHPDQSPGDLNEIAHEVLAGHPGAGHIVTGMVPVFLRTQQAVLDSLILSFGLAFAIIGGVMMLLLRNPLAGGLVMLPNVMPVGVVFGLISWAGLAVDIGTMITASVALGIAVDGTLHLLTWFRSGLRDGLPRDAAVAKALAHCGPAMWQTSAAVGVGLLMFSQAELLLVSRFGWLMSALIGAALVADVILLPALLAGPLGALIERSERRRGMLPCGTPADRDADLPPKQECPAPHLLAGLVSSARSARRD